MNINLEAHHSQDASVTDIHNGYRLSIPQVATRRYSLAQLDDYAKLTRKSFPHCPTRSLSLRARASADTLPGTWGFGLWNDPFGFSIGYGGNLLRIPALPNAIWFFHASGENYLSFSDKPGNGFLAQTFRSPPAPLARLARVGATFLVSRIRARTAMGEIVSEDGVRLRVDVSQWHGYRLEWSPKRSVFWVDDIPALETPVSPRPPLGLVIWIDNQYAAWRPDGSIGFGVLENTEPAWLEVKDLELR